MYYIQPTKIENYKILLALLVSFLCINLKIKLYTFISEYNLSENFFKVL